MKKLLVVLAACGNVKGFSGPVPPLATYTVTPPTQTTGLHHPQVAVVWGMQWLPEALCILPPPADPGTQAALAAGCRDPFGFVPLLAEPGVDVTPGEPNEVDFDTLPDATVLVGQLTGRVGYASIVFYDDLDDSGTLELARPNRLGVPMGGPMSEPQGVQLPDRIIDATFVSMTLPDTRIGYLEGTFDEAAAFYPRQGCGDPPDGFSVLAASGFDYQTALVDALAGQLPPEVDVGECLQAAPQDQPIASWVPPSPSIDMDEVACTENNADSSVRYRDPADQPDGTDRLAACTPLPQFPGQDTGSEQIELIVTGRSDDSCKGLTHYVLKGCREDPNCAMPDWDDLPADGGTIPGWWPCPTS
ncbi:MAG TPA: hypothetical protein VMJ10_22025 [Kofleriaceae bacterium]|nr:hypothetical protein [Kofleriaceae bacterium]